MSRSRKLKVMGASIAALAVAGGGAAIAASKTFSPHAESKAVIDDAAKQLGVTPTQLTDALKKALENRVDEAVADGRLTKEQGAELKERIESSDLPLPFLGLGLPRRFDFRPHRFLPAPFAKFEAAASYLGLSESQLASKLSDGNTLAQIAKEQGKSVAGLVDVLVNAAEKRIDAAVDSGRLTKAQGEDLKSGLRERMTRVVNGEDFGFRRFRLAPGLAPGLLPRRGFSPFEPWFGHDSWRRRGASA